MLLARPEKGKIFIINRKIVNLFKSTDDLFPMALLTCLKWENNSFKEKNKVSLKLIATLFTTVGHPPPLSKSVFKHLGSARTICWSYGRGIYFNIKMFQTFSFERSRVQTSHAVVINAACCLALSWWWSYSLKNKVDGSICFSKMWLNVSALMVPFQIIQAAYPIGTTHRPLNWVLQFSTFPQTILSELWPRDHIHIWLLLCVIKL